MSARKHVLDIPSEVMALPISELGRILAGAMHDPESDDENEAVRHACEMMHFDDVIQQAVRNGQLQPRAPSTCLPMSMATPTSVVTVADLRGLLEDIHCSVEIRHTEASTVPELQPQAAAPEQGTQPKLSEANKTEILRLYNRGRGESVNALAKQFAVSRPTIDKVLQRAGIKK